MKMFTAIALLAVMTTSMAHADLERAMKGMRRMLKQISLQVSDPAQNAASAQLADRFVQYVNEAKTELPENIVRLPADEQAKRKALYEEMMDQVADLGERLAAAFRKNDNAKANELLGKLDKMRHDGHDEFKGED